MSFYNDVRNRFPLQFEALEKAKKDDKIAHAFLIQSEVEKDRNDFTLALAQLACCPESVNGAPCTVCRICRTIENGTYSGLVKVTPEGKAYQIKVGEAENPQENSIRYFTSTFSLTNIDSAKKKTGIIYDADRMNAEAQNALLKTLEEPPPESMIILVTGNSGVLLPTTISRCRSIVLPAGHINFDFAGAEKLYPLLFDAFNAGNDSVKLEQCAAGIIEIAAALKDEAEKENELLWKDKINAVKEIDERIAKKMTKSMEDSGAGLYMSKRKMFLNAVQCFFSELFMLSQGAEVKALPNPEFFDNITFDKIDADKALHVVNLTEKLLFSFKFPVNEALFIRNFIFNINMES
ncbi:MAG: hypothetical protein IKB71_03550 [Lentisphaeria bacterium]|nr:hypothetical protein [Lentisphaeria bacterium]